MREKLSELGAKLADDAIAEMGRTFGDCINCEEHTHLFDDECMNCHMSDYDYADRHGILAECIFPDRMPKNYNNERIACESFKAHARHLFTYLINNK